jgi:hypothetical protein
MPLQPLSQLRLGFPYLTIHLVLVVPVVGQRRVNLSQRKIRMPEVQFLGADSAGVFSSTTSITRVVVPSIQATPSLSSRIWG